MPVPPPILAAAPEAASVLPAYIIPVANLCIGALGAWLTVWAKMAKYQQKVDDLKEDKDRILGKIESLRTDVDTLKEFKVYATKFIDKNLYKSSSPLSLTEFGQQLVKESGFEDIFPSVRDELSSMLQAKNPKTKYDIQEMARELMDGMTEYPAFQALKGYAFKNGKDFGQILRSGAILLRDYYLSVHPEIKD